MKDFLKDYFKHLLLCVIILIVSAALLAAVLFVAWLLVRDMENTIFDLLVVMVLLVVIPFVWTMAEAKGGNND